MAEVNLKKSVPCASTGEISMLRMELRAVREQMLRQLDAIDTRLEGMLPAYEDAARYQRIRAIAGDRAKTRAFLEGKGR
jgi:hypothetical protein